MASRTATALFMLLLSIAISMQFANAQDVQTRGYVYLTIIDPAPEIRNLAITNPTYPYSRVECRADIIDNLPESVRLNYMWYVDGEFVSEAELLSGNEAALEPGQEVRCELIAYDSIGQASNIATAGTTVQRITVLGITAYAVRNLRDSPVTGSFAVLISLAFISIGISLRRRMKRAG